MIFSTKVSSNPFKIVLLLGAVLVSLSCSNQDKGDILLFPFIESSQITAKVRNSNSIPLTNNTYTELSFDTVDYDLGNFFESSSSDRLTIPTTGKYYIIGQLEYSNSTAGVRKTNILINKDSSPYVIAADLVPASGSTSYDIETQVEALGRLKKGDTVSLQAFQDRGGTLPLLANAYSSVFAIIKLSE